MVRTNIRKGGHGGDRSKAGLPAGYWQEKGGRAAAAAAMAAAKAKELLEEEAAKGQRRRRLSAGSNGPSTEMSSSRPATNICKQCNHARLVSFADSTPLQMKTQRVLVDGSRVLRRAV